MQVPQQVFHFQGISWFGLPAQQRGACTLDDVEAFLKEDIQQFIVPCRRLPLGNSHLPWCRLTCLATAVAISPDCLDQGNGFAQGLLVLQLLEHLGQAVVAVLQ
ncbi:hypothetical protein D9M73_235660 [compost metagenome]